MRKISIEEFFVLILRSENWQFEVLSKKEDSDLPPSHRLPHLDILCIYKSFIN